MRRTLVFFMLALWVCKARGQNAVCDCRQNLNHLVAKTEENYAGYPAKVTQENQKWYRQLKDTLQRRAERATSAKACYYILRDYVRFFRDKHFVVAYLNEQDADREFVLKLPDTLAGDWIRKMDPVEGIWVNPDTSLRLALQKGADGLYKAIVLDSKDAKLARGQVYFTLKPTTRGYFAKYYNSFMSTDVPAMQRGNLFQIWSDELFGKVYPQQMDRRESEELQGWRDGRHGLGFQQLSPKTAYIRIPTFGNNDEKIHQLVAANDNALRASENLIIDISGNSGGSTGWVSLIPYIITKPIIQYPTYLRVSPSNVQAKLRDLQYYVENPIPDELRKYFPDSTISAYKKAYDELPKTGQAFYPIPGVTFPVDSVLAKPKRVALIIDEFCGSSSEYFCFLARQSSKLRSYGVNTVGMMDYEGMSTPTPMPYDKFLLTIPIVRSSWTEKAPIDLKGFKPDVMLDKVPREQWTEWVRRDLERVKK